MILSEKLREKLYKLKKEILSNQSKESTEKNNINFYKNIPKKMKKKVLLKGVRSINFSDGN
jgi:hypothetical protein